MFMVHSVGNLISFKGAICNLFPCLYYSKCTYSKAYTHKIYDKALTKTNTCASGCLTAHSLYPIGHIKACRDQIS